jgi:hypothetical protein
VRPRCHTPQRKLRATLARAAPNRFAFVRLSQVWSLPVFHVHSDETFATFLRDTDKSTGGEIRRAIEAGALKVLREKSAAASAAAAAGAGREGVAAADTAAATAAAAVATAQAAASTPGHRRSPEPGAAGGLADGLSDGVSDGLSDGLAGGLCDVDSRISYTLPLLLPRAGGGLNYLDFRHTQPEQCEPTHPAAAAHAGHSRDGRSSRGSSRGSGSSGSSGSSESASLAARARHPKWSAALAAVLGQSDPREVQRVQVNCLYILIKNTTGPSITIVLASLDECWVWPCR